MIASRATTAGAARVPAAHDDDGAAAAAPDEPVDLGGGSLGFAGGGGASYSLLHIHTLSLIALFDVLLRLFFFLFGVDHFLFPRLIARPQCGELPCCCARTGAHSAVPYADWCSFTTRQRVLFLTFALAGSSTRASPQRLHHPHPAAAAAASAMFQGRGVTAEDVVDPLAHWIPGSKREYIMDTEDEVRARPDRPTRQKILRGHFFLASHHRCFSCRPRTPASTPNPVPLRYALLLPCGMLRHLRQLLGSQLQPACTTHAHSIMVPFPRLFSLPPLHFSPVLANVRRTNSRTPRGCGRQARLRTPAALAAPIDYEWILYYTSGKWYYLGRSSKGMGAAGWCASQFGPSRSRLDLVDQKS